MLANLICWVIALGMMLSESVNREDLYIKTLLAMGFIFLGTLSKAIDTYRDVKLGRSTSRENKSSNSNAT